MLLEIRAAEGGDDAYTFSRELARALAGHARRLGLESETVEDSSRTLRLQVWGREARSLERFAGTHRIQREPKNDRRGRRHTSTVTVAVLDEVELPTVTVREDELEMTAYKGSGKGGQHRNKNATAVRLVHRPTGLVAAREDSRYHWQNYQAAKTDIERRLSEQLQAELTAGVNSERRSQIATGERPVKQWTHNDQRDETLEHSTGQRWRLSDFLRGKIA